MRFVDRRRKTEYDAFYVLKRSEILILIERVGRDFDIKEG
jgi:hypothetical protein